MRIVQAMPCEEGCITALDVKKIVGQIGISSKAPRFGEDKMADEHASDHLCEGTLLAHLEIEYVNFDSAVEVYLNSDCCFDLQQPVACAVERVPLEYGIASQHLLTGRGHHMAGDLYAAAHKLSGHLRMVHINDNRGQRDDHLPPGKGTVDWRRLIRRLTERLFQGG